MSEAEYRSMFALWSLAKVPPTKVNISQLSTLFHNRQPKYPRSFSLLPDKMRCQDADSLSTAKVSAPQEVSCIPTLGQRISRRLHLIQVVALYYSRNPLLIDTQQGVPKKNKSPNFVSQLIPLVLIVQISPPKKFQHYRPKNDIVQAIFSFTL